MAQFAMCSRESMYRPSLTLGNPASPASITAPTAHPPKGMAVQHGDTHEKKSKQKHRKSNKRRYKPFDCIAAEGPTATPAVSWGVQQAESSLQVPESKPRANIGSHPAVQTASSATIQPLPSHPARPPRNFAKRSRRRNNHQKPKGDARNNAAPGTMAGPPDSRYIPPHLRYRNITPASTAGKPDAELGGCVVEQSPAISASSEKKSCVEIQPQTTGTAQAETPPSPPTTVEKKPSSNASQGDQQEALQSSPPVLPSMRENKPRLNAYELYNQMASAGKIDEWELYEKTGYILPPSKVPPTSYKGGNHRGPRNSRKTAWPKAREMKPLPSDDESQGGVHIRSDSEGDQFYDIRKIVDWNGDFLPPPECWAERARYTNRHPGQEIVRWIDAVPISCEGVMETGTIAFTSGPLDRKGTTLNKEIVPRYWVPEAVEGVPARAFMAKLPSRAPPALSDLCDNDSPILYWDRYNDSPTDCFLETLVVPEARIDLEDEENDLECRYALISTTDRLRKMKEHKEKEERKRLARINRTTRPTHPPPLDRSLRPKANFYIRPIQPADVRGIMDIYNYYVTTISATEFDPCTEAEIRDRCDKVVNDKLPFFVAVAKNHRPKCSTGYLSEHIIGYINLNEHLNKPTMYRHTFDLAMFVKQGYVRQGIGKCLLDKMMDYAHPNYPARGGYEYVNDYKYLTTGERRVIKTILISYHYERDENASWMSEYLRPFGFLRAGNFHAVGFKDGKVVDKVMYQQQTSEKINAHLRPIAAGAH